ncbi:hypothetical protein SERLA73DRAFT_185178 [Serpula lacrymans var. lacrymans S7.3]|uniref:MADS-box domain-containing protein n=2 Tax=Serpula lacrymans var. lacrymans TaxID=341189 RepID=F8Q478_SERL3|nr:uncharacterized protein SERLADRAFT_473482 [Serpula lacrymans var. lacrymans S7.9]EGN96934.1 hypothetical protein SERLA73DRAFT_185178 [Serpula lacrymans var. lacrymans S7.3]EGO22527.1 hypothetical protein SERLADRAFT_473482 [Serpula lacrymans var. lacrymans S7.9]
MGRRKIEIQPITHERNRSVTFLKRKNGLFKKAYELGVLCSVDVAVIIFEERAGHHVKLYQYCSGDIHDIVQRHIRYDGEKDTRSPHDFANNANHKLEDVGGDDDDDVDEDDGDLGHSRGLAASAKKRGEPKLKTEYGSSGKLMVPGSNGAGDINMDVGMDYHRPMTIPPPPMPLHHPSQLASSGGSSSSLPLSIERHSSSASTRLLPSNGQYPSKKPRIAPNPNGGNTSKLTTDDAMYNGYLPSPTSAHSPPFRHPGTASHQLAPYGGSSYLGVSSPPSSSFLSSGFDFPSSSSRGPSSRSMSFSQQRSSFSQPQEPHLHGMYQQLMRQNPPSHSNLHPQQPAPDLLVAFLDGEEHRTPQNQGSQFGQLDWPTHAPQQPHHQHPPQAPHHEPSQPGPGDTSWLDFLSHTTPQTGSQQLHMTLPPAGSRDSVSWERERDIEYTAERAGDAQGPPSDKSSSVNGGGAIMSPPLSRKRMRADSAADLRGKREGSSPGRLNGSSVVQGDQGRESSSSNGHGHAEKEE